MADLAAGHRHQPTDQSCYRRILKHHHIGGQKADRAHQMKRLIDPAVMIEAMIVPTLHSQGLEKRLHNSSPCCRRVSMLWRFDESDVTGARRSAGQVHGVWWPGAGQRAAGCAAGVSARAALVPRAWEKRISEKCPNGGIARRSTSRIPRQRLAHSA